jgi:hypothetical protein
MIKICVNGACVNGVYFGSTQAVSDVKARIGELDTKDVA